MAEQLELAASQHAEEIEALARAHEAAQEELRSNHVETLSSLQTDLATEQVTNKTEQDPTFNRFPLSDWECNELERHWPRFFLNKL